MNTIKDFIKFFDLGIDKVMLLDNESECVYATTEKELCKFYNEQIQRVLQMEDGTINIYI